MSTQIYKFVNTKLKKTEQPNRQYAGSFSFYNKKEKNEYKSSLIRLNSTNGVIVLKLYYPHEI